MDVQKLNATLDTIDKTVGALVPLVGTVGSISRLIIGLAKKQGLDTTTFEAEIAKFDAQHAELGSAVAEFRAKYPKAGGAQPPVGGGDPSGPAPGETTTIGS